MAHYKYHNDCQSSVLTYEQVKRLDSVMDQIVPIHGRGQFPTLFVKLKELIRLVKHKLQNEHSIEIRDVCLNGGAGSYVLAPENSHYNDLDLVFGIDLSDESRFDVIRDVVLECLREFYPAQEQQQEQQQQQMPPNNCAIKEAYVHKMVKVIDDDRWSLISLGVQQSEANCYSQTGGAPQHLDATIAMNMAAVYCKQADANCPLARQQSFPSKMTTHENRIDNQQQTQANQFQINQHQPLAQKPSAHMHPDEKQAEQNTDNISSNQQHHQRMVHFHNHHLHLDQHHHAHQIQSQHNNYQQKPLPNSIELKFVDRMRRKFEFSVDSFQIILDSLIQFYDYAPQPTTNNTLMQWKSSDYQQPPIETTTSTMIDYRNKKSTCCACDVNCCKSFASANDSTASTDNIYSQDNYNSTSPITTGANNTGQQVEDQKNESINKSDNFNIPEAKSTKKLQKAITSSKSSSFSDNSQDYFESPRLELANSPPISSEASSSGCSSSSSVVSSSSSSLSYDEDHEDLYCDTYGPSSSSSSSSTSSSASTSSMLSSTATSTLSSSDDTCNVGDIVADKRDPNQSRKTVVKSICASNKSQQLKQTKRELNEAKLSREFYSKLEQDHQKVSPQNQVTPALPAQVGPPESSAVSPVEETFECCNCLEEMMHNRQHSYQDLVDDYDTTSGSSSCAAISENFYPTVICRSEYGDFKEALYHLEKKLIATRSPEEIRGGGLLKYCNLLVKNYKPTNLLQIKTLERYMCSRFFIDFSDLKQQKAKLESYLANHFSDDIYLKYNYLTVLHNVVDRSTVCLMNHDLRLTLIMIRDMAFSLNEQLVHQPRKNQIYSMPASSYLQQANQQQQQLQPQPPPQRQKCQHQSSQIQIQAAQNHQQQQQHHYYHQQKPVLIQSGVYRVKLVNYTLA